MFLGPMAGNEKSEAFGDLSSLKAGAVLHIVSTTPHTTPGTVEALSKCTELDQTCPIIERSSVGEAVWFLPG